MSGFPTYTETKTKYRNGLNAEPDQPFPVITQLNPVIAILCQNTQPQTSR